MTGTILVRNLEFQAGHGASADERRSMRRFQVDVDLSVEVERAVKSDRLSDTLNYHDVCSMVLEVATSGKSRLLERVAAEILQALRKRWPSARVTVELRKLLPPCPGNPSYTAVRLSS